MSIDYPMLAAETGTYNTGSPDTVDLDGTAVSSTFRTFAQAAADTGNQFADGSTCVVRIVKDDSNWVEAIVTWTDATPDTLSVVEIRQSEGTVSDTDSVDVYAIGAYPESTEQWGAFYTYDSSSYGSTALTIDLPETSWSLLKFSIDVTFASTTIFRMRWRYTGDGSVTSTANHYIYLSHAEYWGSEADTSVDQTQRATSSDSAVQVEWYATSGSQAHIDIELTSRSGLRPLAKWNYWARRADYGGPKNGPVYGDGYAWTDTTTKIDQFQILTGTGNFTHLHVIASKIA